MCKLDANSTKNEDVRVPHLKTTKTAIMTSFNVFSKLLKRWNVFHCFSKYFTVTATTVTKTVCEVQLTSKCQNFRYFRYFNGKLRNGRPKYGHIRHQRIQINNNHRFVFRFSQILCLTVFPLFSAAILDRRFEPRMLGCNPIQRIELKKKITKFEEN